MPYLASAREILTLYSELIAVLLAATVLGWFIGTMIQRGRAKRRLKATEMMWEKRYTTLEDTARADADNLEEQLQTIAKESKAMHDTNRALTDSLKKNDASIQKARAESIELNRQHAEAQERLQRIIQQKDKEIVELANRANHASDNPLATGSTHIAPNISTALGTTASDINESDLNHADTVAINPTATPEALDSTIQLPDTDQLSPAPKAVKTVPPNDLDMSMDETADLGELASADVLEESTVAMDDDALAFAQRSYPARKRD